jgi:lysyl-tRNA synthetase class 2
VTDWRPSASPEALRLRARVLAEIRAFFAERAVLEVETPAMSRAATTDPHIESRAVHGRLPGLESLYLNSSPEFAMKRLLAAGHGPIYQIARVFRDGERGRLHNPEFTLLEWYRPGFDHHRLMEELEALIGRLGPWPRCERVSYREAFSNALAIDPLEAGERALADAVAAAVPGFAGGGLGRDDLLDLLLGHVVAPQLGEGAPVFVYDYPASQAALARLRDGEPPVAERFELFIRGIEIANGFHELGDAREQRRRFERDLAARAAAGAPAVPIDESLLAALEAGLPDCAGVAVGLDRLLMVLGGYDHIADVLAFDIERA